MMKPCKSIHVKPHPPVRRRAKKLTKLNHHDRSTGKLQLNSLNTNLFTCKHSRTYVHSESFLVCLLFGVLSMIVGSLAGYLWWQLIELCNNEKIHINWQRLIQIENIPFPKTKLNKTTMTVWIRTMNDDGARINPC